MAETKVLDVVLQLRRDTEANYALVADTFVPANGEICLVDTVNDGLRFKVGDGVTAFGQLAYYEGGGSAGSDTILLGYYFNGKFYTDSTYTVELTKGVKHIYRDLNANGKLYVWDGSKFTPVTQEATEDAAGIVKLYQTHGVNTDGAMSQKAVTDGVNAIKFELDEHETECLVLDLPWD